MEPETGFDELDLIPDDLQSTGYDTYDSPGIIRTICAIICITHLLKLAATALSADNGNGSNPGNQIVNIGDTGDGIPNETRPFD